jgi:hypothetical protein
MPLNPSDREHRGDKCDHMARAVEEGKRAITVVLAHDQHQVALIARIRDELLQVREGIYHDIQPSQAAEAD